MSGVSFLHRSVVTTRPQISVFLVPFFFRYVSSGRRRCLTSWDRSRRRVRRRGRCRWRRWRPSLRPDSTWTCRPPSCAPGWRRAKRSTRVRTTWSCASSTKSSRACRRNTDVQQQQQQKKKTQTKQNKTKTPMPSFFQQEIASLGGKLNRSILFFSKDGYTSRTGSTTHYRDWVQFFIENEISWAAKFWNREDCPAPFQPRSIDS